MVWTQQKQKILRRGGKNTQNYTKKDLHDPYNHDGVITHRQTSWNVKSSGGNDFVLKTQWIIRIAACYGEELESADGQ